MGKPKAKRAKLKGKQAKLKVATIENHSDRKRASASLGEMRVKRRIWSKLQRLKFLGGCGVSDLARLG